ncbi:MAG: CHAT domain-containing protein [Acidobacteria bacterium]|nr:CHAT domain-containing protein [Acidobacteriota bacterium]
MTSRRRACLLAAFVVCAALPAAGQPAAPGPARFSSCRAALAAAPDDYDAAYCFYTAAVDGRAWAEGMAELGRLIAAQPGNRWLRLARGHLQRVLQPVPDLDGAAASYRAAAAAFADGGRAEGELLARSSLRDLLAARGETAAAGREVERVITIGRGATDPIVQARAWSVEASHVLNTGGDVGRAYGLLRRSERAVVPDGPYRMRRTAVTALANVAFRLGRVDEAVALYRRLGAMAQAEGDTQTQVVASANILNTEVYGESWRPTPGGRERLLRLARESLALGLAASRPITVLRAHRVLADLLAADHDGGAAALDHAAQCAALAATTAQYLDEAACRWQEARLRHASAPAQARAAAQLALAATARANNPLADGEGVGQAIRFSWLSRPRAEAARESLTALDALETLRALQDTPGSSAEASAFWTTDYYWLAGRLLLDHAEADVAGAFAVAERLRARTLLEARAQAPRDPSDPVVAARQTTLAAIAALQRGLMDPASDVLTRQRRLGELADLELAVREADRRLANGTPRPGAPLASLDAVQQALGPGQALLSYHLGLWQTYTGDFGGGAWLTVVTPATRRIYKVPDRTHFAAIVPVFAGLLARRGHDAGPAAARLYDDVFGAALRDLPAGTTQLVLVPDGPLHGLPFEALRAGAAGPPLAARYEIEVTPSATLWLATRASASPAAGTLVLADPSLDGAARAPALAREAWPFRGGLGPLPNARREARAARRHLDGVDARAGADASEHALKRTDLGAYGVVHFAAHAVADEAVPERSAVLLAAGDAAEDGLLQAREIEDLDWSGTIVILSACQTASGSVVDGEGVMSLARAFFAGGARTVIGTRWPVGDRDAAAFFETFYRALGEGVTVSAALASAKRQAIDAGASPALWAGVVLLGDGGARPGGRAHGGTPPWGWAVALAALAGGVGWLWLQRGARRG